MENRTSRHSVFSQFLRTLVRSVLVLELVALAFRFLVSSRCRVSFIPLLSHMWLRQRRGEETPTLPSSMSRISTGRVSSPSSRDRLSLSLSLVSRIIYRAVITVPRARNDSTAVCTENRTRIFPLLHNQSFPHP